MGIAFENRTDSSEFLKISELTPQAPVAPSPKDTARKDQLKRILEAAGVTEEDLKVRLLYTPYYLTSFSRRTRR